MALDLEQKITGIREQLGQIPAASATFAAYTRLEAGFRTLAQIRQFQLTVDEPAELGGTDAGPNPVELVLAALGTCQEIVYAAYAALLGVELRHVAVEVSGKLDPRGFFGVAEVDPGFSEVSYTVQLESPTDPERVAALVRAVQEHCPVLDILKRPLLVTGSVALNGHPFMDV
jgi:putative redox protein